MDAQKKRNELLKAKSKIELFTTKIDESNKEACYYLALMCKKALTRARGADVEDLRED